MSIQIVGRKMLGAAVTVAAVIALAACTGGGGSGAPGTPPASSSPAATAAKIILSTSSTSVKSDNSNSATITATVVDVNNIPVSGGTINFSSATADALGVSSGIASSNGVVTIPFSAGLLNRTGRTEVITAKIVGNEAITAQIPIQVIGSTMTVTPSVTSTSVGNSITLKASVMDAAPTGVPGQSIRFTIPTGNGTLSGGTVGTGTATVQTVASGSTGETTSVTFVPSIPGSIVVTAEWIDGSGNTTQTVTTSLTATAVGIAFAVTSPATDPTPVVLGATQAISVSVPTSILYAGVDTPVANVRFASTLGKWSNNAKTRTIAPTANAATETLTAGASSGIANIQIDALSSTGAVLSSLTRVFALSASAASANSITLQSSVSNVEVSTGGTSNSATLTATVRDAPGGNTVANVPVLFEIVNPTGSGERISPVVYNTGSDGKATATFTSGTMTTVGGLQIRATVVGGSGASDTKTIFVNGSGVSLSLGMATVISSVNDSTNYKLPMSILVVSNTGAAVANALVTLSAFPARYYRGSRDASCAPVYDWAPGYANEDTNENDNLDTGEDRNPDRDFDGAPDYVSCSDVGASCDGMITPPHSTAGALPSTVTTDANGVASFDLVYQKQYASWVKTRVRAKVVIVAGTTESTNELSFILPYANADAQPTCSLPSSPDW